MKRLEELVEADQGEIQQNLDFINRRLTNPWLKLQWMQHFGQLQKRNPDGKDYYDLENQFFFYFYRDICQSILLDGIDNPDIQSIFAGDLWYYTLVIQKMGFVKYMYLTNQVEEKQLGNFVLYADFVNDRIIYKREDFPFNGNPKLFDNNCLFYKFKGTFDDAPMFEYNSRSSHTIMDTDCYVTSKHTIIPFLSSQKYYRYGKGLIGHTDDEQKLQEKKNEFAAWLTKIDTFHNEKGLDVTNLFFIPGYNGRMESSHLDGNSFENTGRYSVCAYLGIDYRKGKAKQIVSFLNNFETLLKKLSFSIIEAVKNYMFRQTALKASMAQVMARNLSHNFGSHVFSNLINRDAYSRISDSEVLQSDNYLSNYNGINSGQSDKNLQIIYFNQYLKSRMDYLSEVTFGIPNMLTTKYVYDDVFKELDRVRILLIYISGIPDFKYTFCLKHNGEILSSENDIAIAFPSDVLGNQAFYNIIENIIRNTAKHASRNTREVNTFTIDFIDNKDYPEFYSVEIDNGIPEKDIDNLVKKQNKFLNESVLDKNNSLRNHSLGLLEMAASAAFLRQVDVAKVDSYDYHFADGNEYQNSYGNLILLKAINKNSALGYRFFMQKPKEILLVGNWIIEDSKKEELLTIGIKVIDEEEFVKAMLEGISFSHPFLLYQEDVSIKVLEFLSEHNACKTLLPVRKLKLGKESINHIIHIIQQAEHNEIGKMIKDYAWAKYYENEVAEKLRKKNNTQINIRTGFDPDKGENAFVSNQVIFLDHSFKDTHNKAWERVRNATDFEAWIENLSSRTRIKLPEFSKYSVDEDDLDDDDTNPVNIYVGRIINVYPVKYEIFEAYHNKVVVLDERIQKYSFESFEGSSGKYGGPIPCADLFKSTNVHIPQTQLDPNSFTEEAKKELEHFVDDNLKDAFLLVHYGILERIYKNETIITNKLNEWAEKAKRVVVTSGRGAHSLPLPPSVCFVNLSSVLYAFRENRNKFIINCLLNQSRRKYE